MQTLRRFRGEIALMRNAFRGYEKAFVLTTLSGIVGGLLGSIGIGALIPLFAFISKQGGTGTDKISTFIYGIFDVIHVAPTPLILLSFVALLFIAKAFVLFFANRYGQKMAIDYEEDARKTIFAGLLGSKWEYLLQQKTGHLERVLMNDTANAGQVLYDASSLVFIGASVCIYIAVAFTISAKITLVTIVPAAIILLFSKRISSQIRKRADLLIATEKEIAHHVTEHLLGAKTIKALAAAQDTAAGIFADFKKITELEMRMVFYKHFSASFFEPISLILIGIIFLFSYTQPDFNLGYFAAAMYIIQKIFGYLQTFEAKLQNIDRYAGNLKSVLRYKNAIAEREEKNPGSAPFAFTDQLEFKHVGFAYGGNESVLKDVSFSIKKGERAGIIGPSGSGKTTIADLLLRLFEPKEGSIEIDGKNADTLDIIDWRKKIGYVSQDAFLLNDTIENNIKFYNHAITMDDVRRAAALGNILDTIDALPERFDTIVGERGVKLSGGQRQRIVLARVLARNPEILILDEATSALDNESERLIQKTLESIHGKVTVLAIAHRMSTLQDADIIISLDKGKVTEVGSPAMLLKKESSYFKKMSRLSSRESE